MSTAFHERSSFSVVFLCEANIGKVQALTHSFVMDYPGAQVLVTPKQKRCIASDIVIFLRPLFYSMVGRAKNTTPERGIIPPTFCRLLTPDHPHFADGKIPSNEQKIMKHATKAPTKRAKSIRFPEYSHMLCFNHKVMACEQALWIGG